MNGPLQYLSHGKALCGKVFARFVETYNGLVDFCANLEGDGDVAGGDGRITVDRADPAHPVIRCSGCGDSGGGGSGGDDPGGGGDPGGDTGDEETPSGVTSVNGADGAINIIGGANISVSTSGKTITVSYQEGKEPDEDPNADPCDHDEGGGAGGGVLAGGGGGGGGGGVPAGGDGHPGDDDCNCD